MQTTHKNHRSPSTFGWALLLLAVGTAVFLRFYNLGNWPPGLYRDEAFNGLDALRVLDGEPALFFIANNGREPLYITLTALSVALFGRTVLAVRLAAAVVGSLTTWLVYKLGRSWFGWRVGLLAAWLWAITLWPVHLSRLGLRTILLPAALALAFWLVPLLWPVPDQASDPAVTTSHALRYIFGVWLGMIVLGVFLWRRTARQIARENQS